MDSGQNTPLWLVRAKRTLTLFQLSQQQPIIPDGCGGNFTATSGTITSPGYPHSYGRNKTCIYTISTTPGSTIFLNISSMSIESGDIETYPDYYDYDYDYYIAGGMNGYEGLLCWDYLEVRDGATEESSLIDVYCGWDQVVSIPIEIQSSQNNLWIK